MEIAGFVATSHAPFWDMGFDSRGPGDRFIAAIADARDSIAALAPDVLVIFGPDHFRNFFFDTMPAFCIGADKVEAVGDYGTPKGPLPTMPTLGRFVFDQVSSSGFDPALSLRMGVDHGIAQPYATLTAGAPVPMLPIMINCSGVASATMRRCFDFGRAVGRAIRAAPISGRAVIVGSGGLSHSPGSGSPYDPTMIDERRDYLVNGRDRIAEFTATGEARIADMLKRGATGPVNAAWDEWFLAHYASGDVEPLLALTAEEVLRDGGTGGQEVRTWIAALGAWDRRVTSSTYEPMPTWITGMGVATG